ncbi:hypothetical protein [Bowmanella sp. JS7-9]|uniref:DUF2156 domain-containing protein n=1 Tax=Pseudobowmanella zhangzhouensis TaxID=1537679 RepID=A0ABW1XL62_9ALTE|nr:hypothetical protein [Bowmanella sp. JS7-9]TBX20375.1 hypothetical protein TK45_15415 [Bowmanella sp. JS7-9]
MFQHIDFIDVTLTHSPAIGRYFEGARDCQVAPSLFAVQAQQNVHLAYVLLYRNQMFGDPTYVFEIKLTAQDFDDRIFDFAVERLLELCRQHGIRYLNKQQPIVDQDEMRRFQQHGFKMNRWLVRKTVRVATILALFEKVLKRFKPSAQTLAQFSFLPYTDNTDALNALCNQGFGQLTHEHLYATGEYPSTRDYQFSTAFYKGEEIVASLGIGVEDGCAYLDPLNIASAYQDTWVFAYFIAENMKTLLDHGITESQIAIIQDNQKMTRISQKLEGKVTSTEAFIYQKVTDAQE